MWSLFLSFLLSLAHADSSPLPADSVAPTFSASTSPTPLSSPSTTTLPSPGSGGIFSGFDPDLSKINPQGAPDFLNIPTGGLRDNLAAWATYLLNIITLIAGILAVFYLIYGGILYITSGGNQDRIKTARATIINTIIGVVVIVAAYFLIKMAISIGSGVSSSLPV